MCANEPETNNTFRTDLLGCTIRGLPASPASVGDAGFFPSTAAAGHTTTWRPFARGGR